MSSANQARKVSIESVVREASDSDFVIFDDVSKTKNLSISLTDKTPLRELFDKAYSNDVKEQLGPLIPGLFD